MINPSRDYKEFKIITSNREISPTKVRHIMKSIKEMDLTEANPIIVNQNFEVLDGQHRLEACKLLKLPIYWHQVPVNGLTDKAMILLNANQQSWTQTDYVRHYAKKGVDSYKIVLNMVNNRGYSMSCALSMCSQQGSSTTGVKNGTMKIGKIPIYIIDGVLKEFRSIISWNIDTKLVRAVVRLLKSTEYDHRQDFVKISAQRYNMVRFADDRDYVKFFEECLNKGKMKKNRVKL